ncbi:MAG: hypothetical protein ACXWXD_12850 [Candidatus Deferrimicrobiaceae bacterium]
MPLFKTLVPPREGASIASHVVTYDLARLMKAEGVKYVKEVKCSEFGDAIIANM